MSKQLKEVRAANKDPINFTCGGCRKVQLWRPEKKFECPDCGYGKDPVQGE